MGKPSKRPRFPAEEEISPPPPAMMEAPTNGGLLYHEAQESKLCAVHCVNTVLQGPFFSELDLAAIASDLDRSEQQVMIDGGAVAAAVAGGDFLSEDSHNVSTGGDFSIQVLVKALEVWDLQIIPFNSPDAGPSKGDPDTENAFICHLHDHWFCVRKVNGEWYNFNSLYPAPEHLSKFYLSAFLDSLRGSGWSIFVVRGSIPKECPVVSDAASSYGQWFTPDDAERMTRTCYQPDVTAASTLSSMRSPSVPVSVIELEERDLNAAIAASLMDAPSSGDTDADLGSSAPALQDAAAAATLTPSIESSGGHQAASAGDQGSSGQETTATASESSGGVGGGTSRKRAGDDDDDEEEEEERKD